MHQNISLQVSIDLLNIADLILKLYVFLLSEESLNIDGQQFHQHQQNEYKNDHDIVTLEISSCLGTGIKMWRR